jgi:hypothetical protein
MTTLPITNRLRGLSCKLFNIDTIPGMSIFCNVNIVLLWNDIDISA